MKLDSISNNRKRENDDIFKPDTACTENIAKVYRNVFLNKRKGVA